MYAEVKLPFTDERLDPLMTGIQETGNGVDLPEYLLEAAKRLGIKKFVLEELGPVLWELRVLGSTLQWGRDELVPGRNCTEFVD